MTARNIHQVFSNWEDVIGDWSRHHAGKTLREVFREEPLYLYRLFTMSKSATATPSFRVEVYDKVLELKGGRKRARTTPIPIRHAQVDVNLHRMVRKRKKSYFEYQMDEYLKGHPEE